MNSVCVVQQTDEQWISLTWVSECVYAFVPQSMFRQSDLINRLQIKKNVRSTLRVARLVAQPAVRSNTAAGRHNVNAWLLSRLFTVGYVGRSLRLVRCCNVLLVGMQTMKEDQAYVSTAYSQKTETNLITLNLVIKQKLLIITHNYKLRSLSL